MLRYLDYSLFIPGLKRFSCVFETSVWYVGLKIGDFSWSGYTHVKLYGGNRKQAKAMIRVFVRGNGIFLLFGD